MIKFSDKVAPANRRVFKLDPTTIGSVAIKPGMVVERNSSGFAVKGDGAHVIGGPAWAFVDTSRKDVAGAVSMTVVEGPFSAEINTDGYTGSPALNDPMACGTAGNVGKLATQTITANDCTTLQKVLAYCTRTADADGFIEIKTVR